MPLNVVKLLNWQVAWTERGFEWHADTKHSRSVLLKHGLVEKKSTSAVSSGSEASGTHIRDGEDYLGEHEAKEYASAAGLCSITLGPSGLAVHGGSVDVVNHEVAAETPGYDEALLEVCGAAPRLPRVARRECDLD